MRFSIQRLLIEDVDGAANVAPDTRRLVTIRLLHAVQVPEAPWNIVLRYVRTMLVGGVSCLKMLLTRPPDERPSESGSDRIFPGR